MNNNPVLPTTGNWGIVATANGDVTGDGVMDLIYLTGTKTTDSPFVQNITLHVRNRKTGMIINH